MDDEPRGEHAGYEAYYSSGEFWRKVRSLPRSAGEAVLEKALLLYVILTDPGTPAWARILIVAVLGYFIWPIDAVPDCVPVAGYADDVGAMALVVTQMESLLTPAMRERAKGMRPDR